MRKLALMGLLATALCALSSSAHAEVVPLEDVGAVEQSAESQNGETMREITSHQINECNQAIQIEADEPDPRNGNASHVYKVTVLSGSPCRGEGDSKPQLVTTHHIAFQHGPIKEVGTNGVTHEALLAILIDRMRGFQSGPYSCRENALALTKLEEAKHWLEERTRARVARGVEGTHTV